jgi:Grap2 and cyclin-D-interacting
VWEVCDELVALADGGIGAFVVKKAELWLGLIKDAVEELGEWDPEEDGVDGLFGDDAQQDDNAGEEGEEASELIEKAKAGMMKVLTRVPQSLHVVVKQRLRKMNWDVTDSTRPTGMKPSDIVMSSSTDQDGDGRAAQDATVDHVLRGMQHVSETVDEMAEALYMGQLNRSGKLVKDVWKATVEVVKSVMSPLKAHPKNGNVNGTGEEQAEKAEDKYIRRALDWINVVEPKSSVSGTVTNGSFQEIKQG